MEIEYTLTPDDAIAFQRYHYKMYHARQSYWMRFFWGTLIAVLLFIIFLPWHNIWSTLFPLLFWLVYQINYPLGVRNNITSYVKRMQKDGENKALWGNHRLKINEQEYHVETDVGEMRLRWIGVERVVENEQYIFIYESTNSAHMIPKKFFTSTEQAEVFYQTAKKYFDNARQTAKGT
jgi:hypothetical protein